MPDQIELLQKVNENLEKFLGYIEQKEKPKATRKERVKMDRDRIRSKQVLKLLKK